MTQSLAFTALCNARDRLSGRADLIDCLERAVQDPGRKARVVVLTGAPGIGKTSLALIAHLAATVHKRRSIFLPANQTQPTPTGVRQALQQLGLPGGFSDLGFGERRDVLIIDGLEHLWPVVTWLWSELLVCAGTHLTVIVTSRRSLTAELAPYEALLEVENHSVNNLSLDDTGQFLSRSGVPVEHHHRLFERSEGHPLVLSLLARSPEDWHLEGMPEGVGDALAQRVLADPSTAGERLALAALVVLPACDASVLEEVCGPSSELYTWLRSLPYVQDTHRGLTPHDLVREVVFTALLRRDRSLIERLGEVAARRGIRQMLEKSPVEQRAVFIDTLYALRARPLIAERLKVQALAPIWHDPAPSKADLDWAAEQVENGEGPQGVRAFRHHSRQRTPTLLRGPSGTRVGLVHTLSHEDAVDGATDPVTARALQLAREISYQRGGPAFGCRWMFAGDSYQAFCPNLTATLSFVPQVFAEHHPGVTLGILVFQGVERWREMFLMTPVRTVESMSMDGVEYNLALLDLSAGDTASGSALQRAVLPTWTAKLAGLDLEVVRRSTPLAPGHRVGEALVREALVAFHIPQQLEQCELLKRFPGDMEGLREQICDAIAVMASSHAHSDLAAVLDVTYVQGAVKQRAAAADLGLPWGTYRHRLRRSQEVLAAELSRRR